MARKKKIKPAVFEKQLFIFSNDFEPLIDTWFKGSVIFEYNLKKDDISKIPELQKLIKINKFFDINYPKVTCVINYQKSGLLFTSLKNDCAIFHVGNRTEQAKLSNLALAVSELQYRLEATNNLIENTEYIQRLASLVSKVPKAKDTFNKESVLLDKLAVQMLKSKYQLLTTYRELCKV